MSFKISVIIMINQNFVIIKAPRFIECRLPPTVTKAGTKLPTVTKAPNYFSGLTYLAPAL